MTQPQFTPEFLAAVAAALQQQGGVALLAPAVEVVPLRDAWVCVRCGNELPWDLAAPPSWEAYVGHLADNHHSLILRLAQAVDTDDEEFHAAHAIAREPDHPDHADDVHAQAIADLAGHLTELGWPTQVGLWVEKRELLAHPHREPD